MFFKERNNQSAIPGTQPERNSDGVEKSMFQTLGGLIESDDTNAENLGDMLDDSFFTSKPLITEAQYLQLNRELRKKERRENKRLKELTTIDYLTNILNRRGLERELNEARKRLKNTKKENEQRESNPGHILFFIIDVDNFKIINDGYGHNKGDEALRLVATCLEEEAVRRGGKVGRYGGDEFAIIEESGKDLTPAQVKEISLRIQENLNSRLFVFDYEKKLGFTVSVGGSILNIGEDKTLDRLKKEADGAMYEAKNGS